LCDQEFLNPGPGVELFRLLRWP